MPKIRFNKQRKQLEDAADAIVKKNALVFHADIVVAWPVDTGFSKEAWAKPVKEGTSWVVANRVTYSSILWQGRTNSGDGMRGSVQLPMGGSPILNRTIQRIKKDFKAL